MAVRKATADDGNNAGRRLRRGVELAFPPTLPLLPTTAPRFDLQRDLPVTATVPLVIVYYSIQMRPPSSAMGS